ncbi:MAG TPA: magnesium chelatase ATPase subunit I, partial [Pyrinomonadaceae bacterium]|nr:magnesium chelatase ATPase subunit I [Pyrinomonadaceae bacterium]
MTRKKDDTLRKPPAPTATRPPTFPFAAIVGQEEMKLGLLLNVIAPAIGGVLVMGHRGTAKSTAVRALAELLPPLTRVRDCAYNCDPQDSSNFCADCRARVAASEKLTRERAPVPVVELPLNATEDRVCGTINIERAIKEGVKAFEPGLLARAHRGFLYIDEVNLLEDHLVDLLLDTAATGRNRVEREGISLEHPARFVLVGSGNPEEGELRPQLLDRFGLYTEIRTADNLDERVEIITRREAFDADPAGFCAAWENEQARLRRRLVRARESYARVRLPARLVRSIAELCQRLGVDGHRGELTIARAARALAAFENRKEATAGDVRRVAAMALGHRLRRDPLEQTSGGAQIEQATEELFGGESSTDDEAAHASDDARRRKPKKTPPDEPGDAGGNGGVQTKHDPRRADEGRATNPHGEERPAPPLDARLPRDAHDELQSQTRLKKPRATSNSRARRRSSSHTTPGQPRGRYSRATARQVAGAKV